MVLLRVRTNFNEEEGSQFNATIENLHGLENPVEDSQ